MDIISFEDVSYAYNQEGLALSHVTAGIEKGSVTAIIGHNGSGKSTLAKHINGLFVPKEGAVTVCGMNTADESLAIKIHSAVGMVFQNPDNQMVTTIVEDDVAFGPENLGIPPLEIRKRVDEALSTVRMGQYALSAPHNLSGGQKQRIAIAGVLAMEPQVIVLDEATAMLDPQGRQEVLDTVLSLNRERGITLVLITHFMEEAALADSIMVMSKGELVLKAPPREVFKSKGMLARLGLDVPFAVTLGDALREKGMPLGMAVTDEEMVEELCPYLLKT